MNVILTHFKKHTSLIILILALLGSSQIKAEESIDLMIAAQDGDLKKVKELIEADVDVNHAYDENDWTALLYATLNGHLDIVKELIKAGADANHAEEDGLTALMIAAANGKLEIAQELIKNNASINYTDDEGSTALIQAAESGHLQIVKELIKAGADINHADQEEGATALIQASWKGYIDIVQALIIAGADTHHVDENGWTALTFAAHDGHVEVVTALLTEIPTKDAEQIKNNFTGFSVLNRMQFMPKDVRKLITETIVQELIDERLQQAQEIMRMAHEEEETVHDIALNQGHQEVAALLDLNNAESQKKLRTIIENKIRRILFGEPRPPKEKTIELDDPFGTWD